LRSRRAWVHLFSFYFLVFFFFSLLVLLTISKSEICNAITKPTSENTF
jgi:hypothetical protein